MKSINDLLQNINLENEFQVTEFKAFKENYECQFFELTPQAEQVKTPYNRNKIWH